MCIRDRSVKEAKAKLTPAKASVAVGKAEGISFNRRVLREGVKAVSYTHLDVYKRQPYSWASMREL